MRVTQVVAHIDLFALGGTSLVLVSWSVAAMVLVGWCYTRGLRRIRRHPQGRRLHRWRPFAVVGAAVVVLAAMLPPLGTLAEARLSTHMAQHMMLILVAAPMLALAAPGQALLAGMPSAVRQRVVAVVHRLPLSVLCAPLLAWALHVGAVWFWHLPAPYEAAVRSDAAHLLEHAAFFGTAWLFWWHLATLSSRRLRGPAAVLYMVAAIPPGAALAAVLTFAGSPIYDEQAAATAALGADPLLDQRIGGLVMWVPMDLGYILVAVLLFNRWFKGMQQSGAAVAVPPDPASPHRSAHRSPGSGGVRS
jgi:putative membrane protein